MDFLREESVNRLLTCFLTDFGVFWMLLVFADSLRFWYCCRAVSASSSISGGFWSCLNKHFFSLFLVSCRLWSFLFCLFTQKVGFYPTIPI